MERSELHRLLKSLHTELGRATSLDGESRALLNDIARDVEWLGARQADDAAGRHVPALRKLAVRFESEHPALAGTLRQLVDALGKAGI
jgi:hypothetical protein